MAIYEVGDKRSFRWRGKDGSAFSTGTVYTFTYDGNLKWVGESDGGSEIKRHSWNEKYWKEINKKEEDLETVAYQRLKDRRGGFTEGHVYEFTRESPKQMWVTLDDSGRKLRRGRFAGHLWTKVEENEAVEETTNQPQQENTIMNLFTTTGSKRIETPTLVQGKNLKDMEKGDCYRTIRKLNDDKEGLASLKVESNSIKCELAEIDLVIKMVVKQLDSL